MLQVPLSPRVLPQLCTSSIKALAQEERCGGIRVVPPLTSPSNEASVEREAYNHADSAEAAAVCFHKKRKQDPDLCPSLQQQAEELDETVKISWWTWQG